MFYLEFTKDLPHKTISRNIGLMYPRIKLSSSNYFSLCRALINLMYFSDFGLGNNDMLLMCASVQKASMMFSISQLYFRLGVRYKYSSFDSSNQHHYHYCSIFQIQIKIHIFTVFHLKFNLNSTFPLCRTVHHSETQQNEFWVSHTIFHLDLFELNYASVRKFCLTKNLR
jgi:hypothetical protein